MNLTTDIGAYMHTMSPQQERRLFAALAMQGVLIGSAMTPTKASLTGQEASELMARMAVIQADALLAELAKPVSE